MILGFPRGKHGLCPGSCRMRGYQPLIYFLLISSQNFIILIRFYMLHDDLPHILLYILIWLIFRFPTVKYANTKHGGAGGIILWALLTVFLFIVVVSYCCCCCSRKIFCMIYVFPLKWLFRINHIGSEQLE